MLQCVIPYTPRWQGHAAWKTTVLRGATSRDFLPASSLARLWAETFPSLFPPSLVADAPFPSPGFVWRLFNGLENSGEADSCPPRSASALCSPNRRQRLRTGPREDTASPREAERRGATRRLPFEPGEGPWRPAPLW